MPTNVSWHLIIVWYAFPSGLVLLSIFSCTCLWFVCLFGEMPIRLFDHFEIRLLVLFTIKLYQFLICFGYKPVVRFEVFKYFLPFHSVDCLLQKIFCLMEFNLSVLLLFMLLMFYPRNYDDAQCHIAFPLCFVIGVLWFPALYLSLSFTFGWF